MRRNMEEDLHRIMRNAIDSNQIMGMNILIERDDGELLYCQEGFADREKGTEIDQNTIFRLYSMTKPITAAAVMLLMERGELDLCTPVGDILPSYRELTVVKDGEIVPCERPILVQDLLRMTSGLVYGDTVTIPGKATEGMFTELQMRIRTDDPMTTRELADRLSDCPLAFEPGSGWRYGSSADVLGAVIEAVSNMPFGEFLDRELFEPLNMEDTAFWVPEDKQERLAATYRTVSPDEEMERFTETHLGITADVSAYPAFEAGGAGLCSTLLDYRSFARMLLQGGRFGGRQILRRETVEYMTKPLLMPLQQKAFDLDAIALCGYSYGNLMRVCTDPRQTGYFARKGEYGWDGWLGTYFANFPKAHMTILMGMQKVDAGTFDLTRKLRNVIL